MKDLLELSASAMKRPWFYLGSACLVADAIMRFLKPPADAGGAPSFVGLLFTFLFAVAYICFALVQIRELRDQHVVTIPNRNAWNMGCSLAWFHLKIGLAALPVIGVPTVFLVTLTRGVTGFSAPVLLLAGFLFLATIFFALIYVSGSALVIVRGHSDNSVFGSLESLKYIWLETVLLVVFTAILGIVGSAGPFLSQISPTLSLVGTGLEVLLAPFVYLSRAVGVVFLAKLLRARALDFVRQRALVDSGAQSSSSEA